ncbi:LLM class F420-dependent oxidoreductase [Rhodococcus chondri]|uniref:LLM class F420-dependent oxidoreductase n=1 Tax=Rhodococcus chondri TaxID=3065941 RepID=A0ABU7JQX1_9NOCA|nr:LLM class F420-dependent oxidoreductase [Rhodococcus sp. CC-R104]MEE2032289.1 LLM class F420-dependent oxidoreductase [Rhodococcus sp. CC-R104]
MYIGITSPVVIGHPAVRAPWEQDAGIDELARIAETADRLGYHHVTCSEHVAVPAHVAEERGGIYWDPLATFGYLAARTSRIRLNTRVLVLGYHHPLEIAKRYGTLDTVSGGRLVLGLGVGSLREEFELLGAPFTDRGARADEALAALRVCMSTTRPEFHGTYYDFADVHVAPSAVQERVPFWIGGRTARSLRRAVTLGDGWLPFGLTLDETESLLQKAPLPEGFEVVLSTGRPLDPLGTPESTLRDLERRRRAGATIVSATFAATSADHYREQLEALHELGSEIGVSFDPPPPRPFLDESAETV